MKSELAYSGMLVKELAAKAGVHKHNIDNYLNARGQMPSLEIGVKLAKALGVSAEYLVDGEEGKQAGRPQATSNYVRIITQLAEQFDDEQRKFIIDFMKWLKSRTTQDTSR